MKRKWIHDQTDINVAQFDKAMEENYPEARRFVRDPEQHLKRISEECNYLDAVKLVRLDQYLQPESVVMDFGSDG